jgi:hypothetical protein
MNSPDVMRMLHRLSQGDNFQPEPAPEGQRAARTQRAPRKQKVREPSPDSEYSDSDSESDGYEELQQIKDHYDKEPCEYVSPAGLKATKTKKEAIQYLESKKCPKIPALKKGKMEGPPAPAPATAPAKKVRKAKPVEPTPPVPAVPAPPPKKVRAKKAVAAALPPVAADPVVVPEKTEKKKRAPTAYAICVGKYRKQGLSFAEASKAAKIECDAAKAK